MKECIHLLSYKTSAKMFLSFKFRLFYWAIFWRLIEALGLLRVEFLIRSFSYFGQILELFLENNYFLSNSVKMEQNTPQNHSFSAYNGKFVNKNDFKSKTPKKNSNFAIPFLEFFC